jgi:DNA-binding transcriptional regulator YdaS (Cro superfamily)
MEFIEPEWLAESNFQTKIEYHKARRYFFVNLAAIYASRFGSKSYLGQAVGYKGVRSLDTMASVGKVVSIEIAIKIERATGGRVSARDIRSGHYMPPLRACGICYETSASKQGCPDCTGINNTQQEDEAIA